jgi:hypothetical protein
MTPILAPWTIGEAGSPKQTEQAEAAVGNAAKTARSAAVEGRGADAERFHMRLTPFSFRMA